MAINDAAVGPALDRTQRRPSRPQLHPAGSSAKLAIPDARLPYFHPKLPLETARSMLQENNLHAGR